MRRRKKHEPSPRLVRKWTKGPSTTQRRGERTAALRLLQPPKVVDERTVRLPGIEDLQLENPGAGRRGRALMPGRGDHTRRDAPREEALPGTPLAREPGAEDKTPPTGRTRPRGTPCGSDERREVLRPARCEPASRGGKADCRACAQALHEGLPGLEQAPRQGQGAKETGPAHPGPLGVGRRKGACHRGGAPRDGEPEASEHDGLRTGNLECSRLAGQTWAQQRHCRCQAGSRCQEDRTRGSQARDPPRQGAPRGDLHHLQPVPTPRPREPGRRGVRLQRLCT